MIFLLLVSDQVNDFWKNNFDNVFFEGSIFKESNKEYFFI